MNFKMTFKMAIKSVVSNKLRTLLTMLGIIIGVSSVVVLVSIAEGSSAQIKESIKSMGSNTLSVNLFNYPDRYKMDYKTLKDMQDLQEGLKVAPKVNFSGNARYMNNDLDVTANGIDDDFLEVNNYQLASGRNIVPTDVDGREKVVVIGSEVADTLFLGIDPLGEYIKIENVKYKVIGVLDSKGSTMGMSKDEVVFVPITTAMRVNQTNKIKSIDLKVFDSEGVEFAKKAIEGFLLQHLGNDDTLFRVYDQTQTLETINEVTKTTSMMLGGIAAISLLVGGIGIMNIMMVSVTERTKEIGIRKAIGAKRRNILLQFLIESSVISGLGGIIGIGISFIIMELVRYYFAMSVVTPVYIIVVSLGFSIIVGIFFGLYPANKASKLKPIDALRYE